MTRAITVRFADLPPHLRIGGRRQRGISTLVVLRFQPDESILLRIGAKRPGTPFEMVPAGMKLEYNRLTRQELPDAYVNVLNEILAGGHTVFPGAREIERSWEIVDPLMKSWEHEGHPEIYQKGSWGPGEADEHWRRVPEQSFAGAEQQVLNAREERRREAGGGF